MRARGAAACHFQWRSSAKAAHCSLRQNVRVRVGGGENLHYRDRKWEISLMIHGKSLIYMINCSGKCDPVMTGCRFFLSGSRSKEQVLAFITGGHSWCGLICSLTKSSWVDIWTGEIMKWINWYFCHVELEMYDSESKTGFLPFSKW